MLTQATSHFCAQKEKEKERGELEGGWKRKESIEKEKKKLDLWVGCTNTLIYLVTLYVVQAYEAGSVSFTVYLTFDAMDRWGSGKVGFEKV